MSPDEARRTRRRALRRRAARARRTPRRAPTASGSRTSSADVALRAPLAAPHAGARRRRDHHARARHRRQRRDLLRGQRGRAAAAPVSGARPAGHDLGGESGEALASQGRRAGELSRLARRRVRLRRTSPAYVDWPRHARRSRAAATRSCSPARPSPATSSRRSACAPVARTRTFADDETWRTAPHVGRAQRPRVARHASARDSVDRRQDRSRSTARELRSSA